MSKTGICLLSIVYCLLLNSCGNDSSEKSSVAKNTSAAQTIFEENCVICHGSDGKLNALGAKDLSISTLEKTQMIEIITNGKNTMTPYASILSKTEISAVADYVQTLKK